MKFAICNEMFEGWDFGRTCASCSALGYSGLEIAPFTLGENPLAVSGKHRSQIRQTIEDHDMRCAGLHWLLAKTEGFHLTTGNAPMRKRTSEYLAGLAELCSDLGGGIMVLGSPLQRSLQPGVPAIQAWKNAIEVLQGALPSLEKHNVTLALEPLGPVETNFLNTAEQAVRMIQEIGSPHIQLLLDVKAMSTEQIPIPELIGQYHRQLVHFHANDPNRLGPGMGDVNFQPILRALGDCNYDGWVSVEAFDYRPGPEQIASQSIGNMLRDLA